KDLVKAGEVQAEQAQAAVDDLIERSRRNAERLMEAVRVEVKRQMAVVEDVSRDAYARLEKQVAELRRQMQGPKPAKATKRAARGKRAAKKATKKAAKKCPAKRAAKKKTAKKTTKKSAADTSAS